LLRERMEELKGEFADLEEPFQRYSLLLQLAAYAPQPPCDFTTPEHLFPGCQTKVWLSIRWIDGAPDIRITSDSMLLRGVGLVLMRLLNGLPLSEYADLAQLNLPETMGLSEMFTSQRHQGILHLLEEVEAQIKNRERTQI
jgi:cysteine desulfuration protein SufE